jgi:hypothetical protein
MKALVIALAAASGLVAVVPSIAKPAPPAIGIAADAQDLSAVRRKTKKPPKKEEQPATVQGDRGATKGGSMTAPPMPTKPSVQSNRPAR